MNTEQLAEHKAQGFTHIYRSGTQIWGVKLIEGVPVWHRVEFANRERAND